MVLSNRIKHLFLYAGLGRKEYSTISAMIWSENLKTLQKSVITGLSYQEAKDLAEMPGK